jgi:hypothetical protein
VYSFDLSLSINRCSEPTVRIRRMASTGVAVRQRRVAAYSTFAWVVVFDAFHVYRELGAGDHGVGGRRTTHRAPVAAFIDDAMRSWFGVRDGLDRYYLWSTRVIDAYFFVGGVLYATTAWFATRQRPLAEISTAAL